MTVNKDFHKLSYNLVLRCSISGTAAVVVVRTNYKYEVDTVDCAVKPKNVSSSTKVPSNSLTKTSIVILRLNPYDAEYFSRCFKQVCLKR